MQHRGVWLLAAALSVLAIGAGTAEARSFPHPAFGVVPQDGALPPARDLRLMPAAGISQIRLLLHWGSIEGRQGAYEWESTDATVREAVAHGIEPLFFLYGTPTWAARADGHSCEHTDCSAFAPASAATRDAFASFAAAAVRRYGPGGDFWRAPDPQHAPSLPGDSAAPPCQCRVAEPIRAWQVWNEQNSRQFFAPRVSVRRYARMLRSAGAAIKGVDPGAEVILGGMWGPSSARRVVTPVSHYLRRLYRIKRIERSFDSIALHPYAGSAAGALGAIRGARETIADAGDRRAGTWITEIGWATGGPRRNPYVKGRKGQARLLSEALSALRRERRTFRLRGVFWYSWRDKAGGKSICEWCEHAGLRARSGSAKPAWKAFARVAKR